MNKKEEVEPQETPVQESEIMGGDLDDFLKQSVQDLEKYGRYVSNIDTANMTDPVFKAEVLNLLFAIFSKLK